MAPPHGEVDFYSECTSAVEPKVVARSSSDSTADTTENGSPSISAPDSPLIESPPLVALAPFVAPDIKRRRVARSPGLNPASPFLAALLAGAELDDVSPSDWWTLDSNEDMEAASIPVRRAVTEVKEYAAAWSAKSQDGFWQRKSKKVVLAVVVCRCSDGSYVSFRGMNTEVSLPAGSLCAERAAIAAAASDFHYAAQIAAIAVVDPEDELNPLWPCEVCKSWLSKLRSQNQDISVIALAHSLSNNFLVQVNGELRSPSYLPPPLDTTFLWQEMVVIADGSHEQPWEAQELVYVDGAWNFLHAAQQYVLKVARSRGTHLLVGVHSDETLHNECRTPILENFKTRLGRILSNRQTCSALKDAPWCITHDLISSLGIKRVVTGSVGKNIDVGGNQSSVDPYEAPRELGILEVVQSLDEVTESAVFEEVFASVLLSRGGGDK